MLSISCFIKKFRCFILDVRKNGTFLDGKLTSFKPYWCISQLNVGLLNIYYPKHIVIKGQIMKKYSIMWVC